MPNDAIVGYFAILTDFTSPVVSPVNNATRIVSTDSNLDLQVLVSVWAWCNQTSETKNTTENINLLYFFFPNTINQLVNVLITHGNPKQKSSKKQIMFLYAVIVSENAGSYCFSGFFIQPHRQIDCRIKQAILVEFSELEWLYLINLITIVHPGLL